METFKLAEWAALAEIIGTVAIVVSLLFVGYSINRNTKKMQAVNENYLYEVQDSRRGAEAANSQLSALVVKAQSDVKGCFRNADCQLRVHH